MQNALPRALLSLAVFVGWALITVFLSRLWAHVGGTQALDAAVSDRLLLNLPVAIAFLVAAIVIFRWRDVGLNAPQPGSLRLIWFPALYVVFFVGLGLVVGLPPLPVMLVILGNTVMVGISEELACRGILYQGLRSRFSVWPAILVSTLLFGAVHILNGISTGDFLASSIQAVTAFMTGIAFMAIRIRTRSIYPGIILHGLWDFTLVTTAVGLATRLASMPDAPGTPTSIGSLGALALAPFALILPNFIYGLYLLRHVARDEAAAAVMPAEAG
ncbi:MAG: CPBP family intramembrane glutamic endopeptidase [Bauldia sp.]